MRPPPRKRRKPEHLDQPGPGPGPQQQQQQQQQQQPEAPPDKRRLWLLREQRNLLAGLKSLSKTLAAQSDIDYARLHKSVPTRTEEEVRSMLETLKSQVMSSAKVSLQKTRTEERRLRKPVETWTRLAAAVSGKLSQPISTAFSQMLIVSSTEPGTLMDSVPPVPNRPPTTPADGQGVAAAGRGGGTTPRRRGRQPLPKTPDSALAKTLPAPSQVVPVASPVPWPQRHTSAEEEYSADATTSPAVTSNGSASDSAGPEETPAPPVPPSTSTPAAPPTSPNATSATPPAALHAGSAGSSEPVTQDDSAMFNVSFEKIYCYLAAVHKPNQTCALTPMESAIVLDLLMSLPEEIPKLRCKQLRQHLIQVYQSLSARADSKAARQMVEDLRRRRVSAQDPPAPDDTRRDQPPAHLQATVASGGEGQEAGGVEGSRHADVMRLCPPLNPFMIPPKLLTRR